MKYMGNLRNEKENFHNSDVKTTGHFQNKCNLKISEKLQLTYCRYEFGEGKTPIPKHL